MLQLLSIGLPGRVLAYLALSTLLGAWCASAWLVPRAEQVHRSAEWAGLVDDLWRLGRVASWVLALATLGRAVAQFIDLSDPAEPVTLRWLWLVLRETTWGQGWLVQAAASVGLLWAWRQPRRPMGGALIGAGVLALGACVADALTGHGMAGAWAGAVGVLLHAVHLTGVGVWLGTLAVLAIALYRERDALRRELAGPLFRAITPLALLGGACVVGPGVLMGVEYAGGWRALLGVSDDYTRVLLTKVLFAAGIFGLGAWHWKRAVPKLATDATDSTFARSLGVELLLAALVVLLSGILVALPAAGV